MGEARPPWVIRLEAEREKKRQDWGLREWEHLACLGFRLPGLPP